MRKTLEQVANILKSCESVMIHDYCSIPLIINDDSSGQFLYIKYFDSDGQGWEDTFYTKDNQFGVRVIGSSLILIDEDGTEIQITPLFTKDLESWI